MEVMRWRVAQRPRLRLPKFNPDSGPHCWERTEVVPGPTGQYIHVADSQAQTQGKEQAEGSSIWLKTGTWSWSLLSQSLTGPW